MQNENNNFDSVFQGLSENFTDLTNKIYSRQNPPSSVEVKEVHFKKEKSTQMNTTFQINEIITNLEKLIQFVETEKATILSSSKQDIIPEVSSEVEYTKEDINLLIDLVQKRVEEQEKYIETINNLHKNLYSIRNSHFGLL